MEIDDYLSACFYFLSKPYLQDWEFYFKDHDEIITNKMHTGVPQNSVLGFIFYTIYTSDMALEDNITLATYADGTSLIASDEYSIGKNFVKY